MTISYSVLHADSSEGDNNFIFQQDYQGKYSFIM